MVTLFFAIPEKPRLSQNRKKGPVHFQKSMSLSVGTLISRLISISSSNRSFMFPHQGLGKVNLHHKTNPSANYRGRPYSPLLQTIIVLVKPCLGVWPSMLASLSHPAAGNSGCDDPLTGDQR